MSPMNKAVFLDRDGVLIEESDYLDSLDKIRIFSPAFEAVSLLNQHGFLVIVVSNQSGVARGYFPIGFVTFSHEFLKNAFASRGATIHHFYFCPHLPEGMVKEFAIDCDCRKPKPGMLTRAFRDYRIDPSSSYMIGDKRSDLEAGLRGGVRPILVRTGYGSETELQHRSFLLKEKIPVANDILEAVRIILQQKAFV